MSNEFNAALQTYFQTKKGAYSVVTRDEFNKSQITFVGPEQELAESFWGKRLDDHHGNKGEIIARGHDPEFIFRRFPGGEQISLTISYKTNKPRELRMYLRNDSFKPLPGEYWGIFVRDREIWLCHFSEKWLNQVTNSPDLAIERHSLEPDDDEFQILLNSAPPEQVVSEAMRWKRNPRISAGVLKNRKYSCELFPNMETFLSRKTGYPYMEAHHLVPMGLQANYETNLDCTDNICILNPYAHRLIHHAQADIVLPEVRKLVARRLQFIKSIGMIEDDILGIYCQS